MKLIIFELAGKKEAKKCKSINDIVKLSSLVQKSDIDKDTRISLVQESAYLLTDPKFINGNDLKDYYEYVEPITVNPFTKLSLRIIEPNGVVTTITYNATTEGFKISEVVFKNNNAYCKALGILYLNRDSFDSYFDTSEESTELQYALQQHINYIASFLRRIAIGELELKTAEYEPIIKYGRYHIKPSTVIKHRKPHLVASHERAEHFKVLRSPRYYKDGIVPENEDELRRIPVKGCHVKRDIERVVIE